MHDTTRRLETTWRRELLRVVLRATAGLGAIIYVPSALLALKQGLVGLFVMDTIALAAVIALWWFDSLPMKVRSLATCIVFYFVGVGLLLTVGAVSQIYLLGFSIFTTLLVGVRGRIATVVLNIVTLGIVFALEAGANDMHVSAFMDHGATWAVVLGNFAFINIGLVLSVGTVLDTLEREQAALVTSNMALNESRALLSIAGRTAHLGGWRYAVTKRVLTWSDELREIYELPENSTPTLEHIVSSCAEASRDELTEAIDSCARDGTPFDLTVDAVTAHGKPRSLRLIGIADRDANGTINCVHGAIQDVTAKHEAALRHQRLETQLRSSQKLEAIGTLAGGVAHDFNNLLSVILSYSSLMLGDLPPDDANREDLEEIKRAAERAAALTRQLLAFGRKQMLQPVVVDLNVAVSDLKKLLARLLREDIRLTVLRSAQPCSVFVDLGQLEQVVVNLVVNARDAMPDGGKLTIELSEVDADEAYVAAHPGASKGRFGMLTVTDTGVGMSKQTQEHIFEPFFTTKDVGKGTGLGLATVYGIVQQSGGHLWLYSELGQGTSFRVLFPRTDAAPTQRNDVKPASEALQGTETLLVVEDEAQVREVLCTSLRRQGYTVLEAQNGGEALMLSEQFTATIHLLITDVVMPMMSGRQVAERLQRARPDMAVLYMSGYTENTITHHGVLESGVAFMNKPFTPEVLTRRVRGVLDTVAQR